MNKIKKKELLVPVEEPRFFRHAANEKHREVTVCVITFALPIRALTNGLFSEKVLKGVKKVGVGFPESNLHFNYKLQSPAFIFSVKGKTECRGNDVHDQRIGDAVALAKAQAKACIIASRVASACYKVMADQVRETGNILNFLNAGYQKEVDYVEQEHYRRILNRDSSANIQNS